MSPSVPSLVKMTSMSDISSKESSSIGSKMKGFKSLFHSTSTGSFNSRKSSMNSLEFEGKNISGSEEDESTTGNGHSCVIDPLDLKTALVNTFTKQTDFSASSNSANKIDAILGDDDYKEFMKKPKYIKTVKKADVTASICKRLFLAQELDQNGSDEQELEQTPSQIELQIADEFEAKASLVKSSSSDSIGGQNLKARDKKDKKAIWALTFSKDGRYLASAGKGSEIKVWKVISSPLDRLSVPKSQNGKIMYGSVFQPTPNKIFKGHTNDVLALDWSKNNFLLSSSMDKTVKLWNLKKNQPLRSFTHDDFVTCVKFHPLDDRFFISGCLDHNVRLWSILENEISYEFDAKNLVTAIGFTPSGSLTIVGTFDGAVYFLDTSSLELRHTIQLNKKKSNTGPKITGIEAFIDNDDIKILLTSNDSKIRLCSLKSRQLESYFKGPENNSSQMIATVSDDKKYVISGSENHWVYVWDLHGAKSDPNHHSDPISKLLSNKKRRADHTSFHAHHSVVTCSLIAPTSTLKILSLSNDFIYELNNDLSKNGVTNGKNEKGKSEKSSKLENNNHETLFNKNFIGSIIVTADDLGLIRVFRQDLSQNVRNILTEQYNENSKSSKNNKKSQPQPDKEHRMFLNKNNNLSSSSLLSRGRSFRKNDDSSNTTLNNRATSEGGRQRSSTLDSLTRTFGSGLSISETARNGKSGTNMVCDICGSDKFSLVKLSRSSSSITALTPQENNVVFSCSDCGNELNV